MKNQVIFGLISVVTLTCAISFHQPVLAETVSMQQLKSVVPGEAELQGFVRLQLSNTQPSQSANGADSDFVSLNQDVTQWSPGRDETPDRTGVVSRIGRRFLSRDGLYECSVNVTLCDSPGDANAESVSFRSRVQALYQPGAFGNRQLIGDSSWISGTTTLLFVSGKMMVYISADRTPAANREGDIAQFPATAIEAVAYQTLLHASQQPEVTGVPVQQASLGVNGHILPKNALRVAGQTYVPVAEFAKAMGLTSHWDTKTGALTLSGKGHKTVALTAGSTANTVGGLKAATLTVPVLKQNGQPVMTLTDLLIVTGGRVTGHSGNEVQVKG